MNIQIPITIIQGNLNNEICEVIFINKQLMECSKEFSNRYPKSKIVTSRCLTSSDIGIIYLLSHKYILTKSQLFYEISNLPNIENYELINNIFDRHIEDLINFGILDIKFQSEEIMYKLSKKGKYLSKIIFNIDTPESCYIFPPLLTHII